jgi:hypothetical protein
MRKQIVSSLLASLLLILSALPCARAQTEEGQTANNTPTAREVPAARSSYTQNADVTCCSRYGRTALAQRTPFPLVPYRIRYPRGRDYDGRGYEGTWRQTSNGRHVLIGALIGFGLGAALGAKGNQNPHSRVLAPVLFGGAGALIGAGIGASHP